MTPARPSIAARRDEFRRLHERDCFVLPNPWDVGSARLLESLGFKALATTSAGLAWSLGRPDGALGREQVLAHLEQLVAATALPINADFERGFAATPSGVGESVTLAARTGIAGLSIEDSTGDAARPLYALDEAVDRLRAARTAIDRSGADLVLVARAECFLVGRPSLEETVARLRAYSDAGADCLYAPGLRTREEIAAVVTAVSPKPVNVLAGPARGLTLADLAALGVRRVSVGPALARAAWSGLIRAAERIAHEGTFEVPGDPVTSNDLNALFAPADRPEQP